MKNKASRTRLAALLDQVNDRFRYEYRPEQSPFPHLTITPTCECGAFSEEEARRRVKIGRVRAVLKQIGIDIDEFDWWTLEGSELSIASHIVEAEKERREAIAETEALHALIRGIIKSGR